MFDRKLDADLTKDEAIEEAAREWNSLSDYDKDHRDAFELLMAEEDEDGCLDLNTARVIRRFK